MERLVQTIRRQLQRARGAERFVRLIVGGGIALVGGLWIVTFARLWSSAWIVGAALVLLGIGGLVGGIWSEIDY